MNIEGQTSVSFDNCKFSYSYSSLGSVIFTYSVVFAQITNSLFENILASTGGVYFYDSEVIIDNIIFRDSSNEYVGTGIYAQSS